MINWKFIMYKELIKLLALGMLLLAAWIITLFTGISIWHAVIIIVTIEVASLMVETRTTNL